MVGDSDSNRREPFEEGWGCGPRTGLVLFVVGGLCAAVIVGCLALSSAFQAFEGMFEDRCHEASSRLIEAAHRGQADVVEEELGQGASPDQEVDGLTPLVCAARAGRVRAIELLLDAGVDANSSAGDETPLEAATVWLGFPLAGQPRLRHLETVELLLAAGAEPTTTALRAAAGYPLCGIDFGAGSLQTDVVSLLLEHGVDPDGGRQGPSPLLCAMQSDDRALVRVLLDHEADPDHGGSPEIDQLDRAVIDEEMSDTTREALPLVNGDDIEGTELENVPPLIAAVWRADRDLVALLVDAGADPDLAVDRALTAMHVAAARNDIGAVRQLLEAGASPEPDLRAGVPTPAEVAEELGHDRMVEILDAASADS